MMTELSIIAEQSVNRDTKSAEQNWRQVVRLLCQPTPPARAQTLLSNRDPTLLWQPSQANKVVVGGEERKARINEVLMGNSRHKGVGWDASQIIDCYVSNSSEPQERNDLIQGLVWPSEEEVEIQLV